MSNEVVVSEVRRLMAQGHSLDDICNTIFDQCLAPSAPGLGCDNMTMMIVNLKPKSAAPLEVGASEAAAPAPSASI